MPDTLDPCVWGANVRWTRPDGSTTQLLYAKITALTREEALRLFDASPEGQELMGLAAPGSLDVYLEKPKRGEEKRLGEVSVFARPRSTQRRCTIQLAVAVHQAPEDYPIYFVNNGVVTTSEMFMGSTTDFEICGRFDWQLTVGDFVVIRTLDLRFEGQVVSVERTWDGEARYKIPTRRLPEGVYASRIVTAGIHVSTANLDKGFRT